MCAGLPHGNVGALATAAANAAADARDIFAGDCLRLPSLKTLSGPLLLT